MQAGCEQHRLRTWAATSLVKQREHTPCVHGSTTQLSARPITCKSKNENRHRTELVT